MRPPPGGKVTSTLLSQSLVPLLAFTPPRPAEIAPALRESESRGVRGSTTCNFNDQLTMVRSLKGCDGKTADSAPLACVWQ